jgi:hypothetical protein
VPEQFSHTQGPKIWVLRFIRFEADVAIMMRLDIRRRCFNVGERLVLTVSDFNEAFACFHFGSQLATRLPALGNASQH